MLFVYTFPLARLLVIYARKESCSERDASVRRWSMKLLTVLGLFLDLVGVVTLGIGEVMKGAASLRSLKESYKDSFDYDIQQRPWFVRLLLRLGATLGAPKRGARSEPPPYRGEHSVILTFLVAAGGTAETLGPVCRYPAPIGVPTSYCY